MNYELVRTGRKWLAVCCFNIASQRLAGGWGWVGNVAQAVICRPLAAEACFCVKQVYVGFVVNQAALGQVSYC
jgi:hypothetical protein